MGLELSPYVTAYCLESLTAFETVDSERAPSSYRSAVHYLTTLRTETSPTWDFSAIAFWEGNAEAVQTGLSAEIFAVLAGLPLRARNPEWRRLVESLSSQYLVYLQTTTPDVLAYANAILGLSRARLAGVIEIEESILVRAVSSLNRLRRDGYWEPSWFNAYGGTIEATLAALEVYRELGHDDLLAAEQREVVRYLLSTRDEWGGWHNYRGTADALQALMLLDLEQEPNPSTVVVMVNGLQTHHVAIDPRDPFLSAMELRALDLTPYLVLGELNQVEVRYDGALEPEVQITTRHWGDARDLAGDAISLQSEISVDSVALGGLVTYTLHLRSTLSSARQVTVDLAAPSNAELDEQSLQALRSLGLIEGWERSEGGYRLHLRLDGLSAVDLPVLLVGNHAGESIVPAVVAAVRQPSCEAAESMAVAVLETTLRVQ